MIGEIYYNNKKKLWAVKTLQDEEVTFESQGLAMIYGSQLLIIKLLLNKNG